MAVWRRIGARIGCQKRLLEIGKLILIYGLLLEVVFRLYLLTRLMGFRPATGSRWAADGRLSGLEGLATRAGGGFVGSRNRHLDRDLRVRSGRVYCNGPGCNSLILGSLRRLLRLRDGAGLDDLLGSGFRHGSHVDHLSAGISKSRLCSSKKTGLLGLGKAGGGLLWQIVLEVVDYLPLITLQGVGACV